MAAIAIPKTGYLYITNYFLSFGDKVQDQGAIKSGVCEGFSLPPGWLLVASLSGGEENCVLA